MSLEIQLLSAELPLALLVARGKLEHLVRGYRTDYRGWVALHAKRRNATPPSQVLCWWASQGYPTREIISHQYRGFIVGVAQLISTPIIIDSLLKETEHHISLIDDYAGKGSGLQTWEAGKYAWRFQNALVLPKPIPCTATPKLKLIRSEKVLKELCSALPLPPQPNQDCLGRGY